MTVVLSPVQTSVGIIHACEIWTHQPKSNSRRGGLAGFIHPGSLYVCLVDYTANVRYWTPTNDYQVWELDYKQSQANIQLKKTRCGLGGGEVTPSCISILGTRLCSFFLFRDLGSVWLEQSYFQTLSSNRNCTSSWQPLVEVRLAQVWFCSFRAPVSHLNHHSKQLSLPCEDWMSVRSSRTFTAVGQVLGGRREKGRAEFCSLQWKDWCCFISRTTEWSKWQNLSYWSGTVVLHWT